MSVATKNPFALLGDEDSSRPSTPAAAPAPPPAPAAPATARDNQRPRGGPAARGGKYYNRGGAKSATGPREGGNLNQNGIEEPSAESKKAEGEFRGRGRGRGGRGGRGGDRGRGRPFDRHSQTGKTDSDKKIHQSWGGDDGVSELKTEEAATNDAAAEGTTGADWGAPAAASTADWAGTDTAAADAWTVPASADEASAAPAATGDKSGDRDGRPPRREREPEEEDNTLTLEQYLAQKKESDIVPKLESTRKANEGAGDDIWKDVKPLEKVEEDEFFVGKSKATPKTRTKKEEKVFLEIDARFERPSRGGPRGGGRGGERGDYRGGDRGGDRRGGGRGRGAPRGGRFTTNNGPIAVNVDDETAFPSLS